MESNGAKEKDSSRMTDQEKDRVEGSRNPTVSEGKGTVSNLFGTKKVRKAYTITKQRESWSASEHQKFLEAVELFNRDWRKIEAHVGTKTVIQIRSHAQKHFMKVVKNNTGERVPPPRPKRKSANPYPHKAPGVGTSNLKTDPQERSEPKLGVQKVAAGKPTASSSRAVSGSFAGPSSQATDKRLQGGDTKSLPNFAGVYEALGSMFDPAGSNDGDLLLKLPPLERETLTLLARNLSANLQNDQVRGEQMQILSQQHMPKNMRLPEGGEWLGSSIVGQQTRMDELQKTKGNKARGKAKKIADQGRQATKN